MAAISCPYSLSHSHALPFPSAQCARHRAQGSIHSQHTKHRVRNRSNTRGMHMKLSSCSHVRGRARVCAENHTCVCVCVCTPWVWMMGWRGCSNSSPSLPSQHSSCTRSCLAPCSVLLPPLKPLNLRRSRHCSSHYPFSTATCSLSLSLAAHSSSSHHTCFDVYSAFAAVVFCASSCSSFADPASCPVRCAGGEGQSETTEVAAHNSSCWRRLQCRR